MIQNGTGSMKFYSIHQEMLGDSKLQTEYASAHPIGVLRIGTAHIFFRAGIRHYAVPVSEITGFFRRVKSVPAKLCCGKGEFGVEYLVLCTAEGEAAEIQLPGKKAAQAVVKELKETIPGAVYGVPAGEGQESAH